MSIKRFNGAGVYGAKSNKVWDQYTTLNDFQSIATVIVPAAGQSSITFSNIPQNYNHLQLRCSLKTNVNSNSDGNPVWRVGNGTVDSGSTSYANLVMAADGSSTSASGSSSNGSLYMGYSTGSNSNNTGTFNAIIIDILDYSSTSKFKTMRSTEGYDLNGVESYVWHRSSGWMSQSPIDIITITNPSYSFVQHSQVSLYGIKVAS